jgi:hypothetical protein
MIWLNAGTVLMFLGFFMYLRGESEVTSVGVILFGAACEFLGFFLAYFAYTSI